METIPRVADEDSDEESIKEEHNGAIGAGSCVIDMTSVKDFMIHYKGEPGTSIQENCYLLPVDEFENALVDPPSVTREALGWDMRVVEPVNRRIIFLYGKRGYTGWYPGVVSGYDNGLHTISPSDGTDVIVEDLLACRPSVIREWRFLMDSENETEVCAGLNGGDA